MKYARYEDLPVWQDAADIVSRLLDWTAQEWFRGKGDQANQLQRSALSISNNIAEGFERGTTSELLHFLSIARGSAGEVRSMLGVIERMLHIAESAGKAGPKSEISNLKSQISNSKSAISDLPHFLTQLATFKSACEGISRQLRGWASSLQNSKIEGQRYPNKKTRSAHERRQRRSVVEEQLAAAKEELRRKVEASAAERRNEQSED